jgi:hypothetical protein
MRGAAREPTAGHPPQPKATPRSSTRAVAATHRTPATVPLSTCRSRAWAAASTRATTSPPPSRRQGTLLRPRSRGSKDAAAGSEARPAGAGCSGGCHNVDHGRGLCYQVGTSSSSNHLGNTNNCVKAAAPVGSPPAQCTHTPARCMIPGLAPAELHSAAAGAPQQQRVAGCAASIEGGSTRRSHCGMCSNPGLLPCSHHVCSCARLTEPPLLSLPATAGATPPPLSRRPATRSCCAWTTCWQRAASARPGGRA